MNLKFKDLINKLDDYNNSIIDIGEFNKWLEENIEVRFYIGLTEKTVITDLTKEKFNANMSFEDENTFRDKCYTEYEMCVLFDLLFSYTNIVVPSNYRNAETYDKILNSPVYRRIWKECFTDFDRLEKMLRMKTGIEYISLIYSLADIFGVNQTSEDIERIRDIINEEIDKDKLEILLGISKMNDPMMKKVVEKTTKESVKEVLKSKA